MAIYRYVTEGSFDAYMWQALETKARFIAQVMTGDNAVRRAEDIGGQELSYAEVKAIASGNPAVLTLAEADAELQRLAVLKKNHADEQYLARRRLRELPGAITQLTERLANLKDDFSTVTAHQDSPITVGNRNVPLGKAMEVLAERLALLPEKVGRTSAFHSAFTEACATGWCCIRSSRRKYFSMGLPATGCHFPATTTAPAQC